MQVKKGESLPATKSNAFFSSRNTTTETSNNYNYDALMSRCTCT